MVNVQKIYQVKYKEEYDIGEIIAYFDSRDKAEEFLQRFKTSSKYCEIQECTLNPKYIVNKQADPYYITLGIKEDVPFLICNHDLIDEAEEAQREEYSLEFKHFKLKEAINIMLFASSEAEAVEKAIKKRNEIVASGEWKKERNKALKFV